MTISCPFLFAGELVPAHVEAIQWGWMFVPPNYILMTLDLFLGRGGHRMPNAWAEVES